MDSICIGFVIDMSQSMKEKWGLVKVGGDSKMISVKRAFEYVLGEDSELRELYQEKDIKIFALGLGLKYTESLVSVSPQNAENNVPNTGHESSRVDTILDLLAFSKLVPSKVFLEEFREDVRKNWENEASCLLESYKVKYGLESAVSQIAFADNLQHSIYNNAKKGILYRIHDAVTYKKTNSSFYYFGEFLLKLGIARPLDWGQLVLHLAEKEKNRYIKSTIKQADQFFKKQEEGYRHLIKNELEQFLKQQLESILVKNSIGFSYKNVISFFDMIKARKLINKICEYMLKDIKSSVFDFSYQASEMYVMPILSQLRLGYFKPLQIKSLNEMTQQIIRKAAFDGIQPFVEKEATEIFKQAFEKAIKKQADNWMYFAQKEEFFVNIQALSSIFPETDEEKIYTQDYMFGSTPIDRAVQLAAARLMKKAKDAKKVLVLLSDGDFDDRSMHEVRNLAQMLKEEDVFIISLCIADNMTSSYRQSAKNMKELASQVTQVSWLSIVDRQAANKGYFCYQLSNEQDIKDSLEKIIRLIMQG